MAHSSLRTHRKLFRMYTTLNISPPSAIGHLQCLWWSVEDCHSVGPDGRLPGWTSEDIAGSAMWEGNATQFTDAMVLAGFLHHDGNGGFAIHDYAEWCSKYVLKRWKDQGLRSSEGRLSADELRSVRPCGHKSPQSATSCEDICSTLVGSDRTYIAEPAAPARGKRKTPPPKKPPKPREPNPLWDVTADLWFSGKVPSDQETRVGRIVKLLAERDATPDEVRRRLDRYRTKYPTVADTPEALLKHWGEFEKRKSRYD